MDLQIIGPQDRFPKARLTQPPPFGYIHLAAAVEPPIGRAPFPRSSSGKSELLQRLKDLAGMLTRHESVQRATVYRAVVVPPVGGYASLPGVHPARFDVSVLIETPTLDDIGAVRDSEPYQELHGALAQRSTDLHVMMARCAKSLQDVDKSRPGLFLFNFFVAEDPKIALALWDYLAGWYWAQTGLHNSTVLQPFDVPAVQGAEGQRDDYAFVNHARWDYGLPGLILQQFTKPSFRSYVLDNLLINRTGSMPVLYRLA
ncbi:MAG TPA: hypothetical protein VH561_08750 [Micromonosporaceae bacterium]|jgi:hypothetical protein